jgi:lipid-binding SYLF domain-containing protein
MRTGLVLVAISILWIMPPAAQAKLFGADPSADDQRQEVLNMRAETLDKLYAEDSSIESVIKGAIGYAVFSNTGINVLMLSTANGRGVAHDNESAVDTYMNMFSAGGGVGFGVKNFSSVFVFHTREAFNQFVEMGWNFTGQADAAVTSDVENQGQPGAVAATVGLNQGVTVYQMTQQGLALQATLQGTKYWKDDELNL